MPLMKRRKSNNENIKEKKAIATRLMVMSLKIDDYIYKNKPISLQEAQQYIEEIATYKLKCVNDVRSLQVIEKLTLFMKTIINENTMCHASNEDLNTESSVVKAGITENTNDTKMITNDAVTGINQEDCVDEINIIDLTISKDDEQNESHTEVQNSTMKAMSNMSLHNSVINHNGNTNDLQLPSIVNERNGYGFELNRDSSILIQNGQNKNTHLTIAGNDIKDFGATNVIDINSNHIDNNNIQSPSIINERNGYGIGWNCDGTILIKNGQNKNTHLTIAGNYIKDFGGTNVIDINSNHTDNNNIQSPSIINERNGYGIGWNCDGTILIKNGQNKNTHLTIAGNYIKDIGGTNVIDINSNHTDNNNIQSPSIINERNGYGIGWNCDGSIVVQNEQNKNTRLPFAQNNITDFEIPNVMDNICNRIDSTIQSPSLINERNGYGIGLNCNSPIVIQNNQNQNTYSTIAENNLRDFKVTNVIGNNSNQIGNKSNQNIQKLFGISDKNIENKQNLIIKDVKTCKCLRNDNEINVITPKVNDKKDKKEATVKNSKRKEKTVRTRKAIKSTDSDNTQKINKTRKKKGEITKKNSKRSTKINVLNTFDSNNNSVKNNVLPGLYKEKERKEDFSWIENLKYIREISKEEYDTTQIIEETFWNDLSLPVDFNVNDFDYID